MKLLDGIPYPALILAAVLFGLAPFTPEPHAVEKVRMLLSGNLVRPLDIFDLLMHLSPACLLLIKRLSGRRRGKIQDP